jgi:hypothetical protein
MNTTVRVNVAPSSDEGHFVEGKVQVLMLDEITESFRVIGNSELVTKNHTTLQMKEDCLIVCQQVYNPFTQLMERARD